MSGQGVELRMRILRDAAAEQIVKPLQTHGWVVSTPTEHTDGEYLVIASTKFGAARKVALMYSTGTDNKHYRALDGVVDRIFINGELYRPESYAYGISVPVEPVSHFFPVLVQWNKELAPEAPSAAVGHAAKRPIRHITSERPLDGIWAHLDHLASVTIAAKLVRQRADTAGVPVTPDAVGSKASGVAFAVRSASDYYRAAPVEALNKRILSLYYGTLALAFAEMLSSPTGPSDLDEVEGMTKLGHGLYTVPAAEREFGNLSIGVLASGFFPRWVSFLGYDTGAFPRAKPKTPADLEALSPRFKTTLREALGALPELADLFLAVFDEAPSWVVPVFDFEANPTLFGFGKMPDRPSSTYITLVDPSRRLTAQRIQEAGWPLAEVSPTAGDDDGQSFRVRVDHAGYEYWHEALPIHRSPFDSRPTLIVPTIAGVIEYRVVALTILYALSIMVRYMPSAWRRVEGGDWDQHLVVVRTAVSAFERILPQQFLESITGEKVHVSQPGAFG